MTTIHIQERSEIDLDSGAALTSWRAILSDGKCYRLKVSGDPDDMRSRVIKQFRDKQNSITYPAMSPNDCAKIDDAAYEFKVYFGQDFPLMGTPSRVCEVPA